MLCRAMAGADANAPHFNCFSEQAHDAEFHFQILCLDQQLYIWIGCNSARLGNLVVAMPTRFDCVPSVSSLLGAKANGPAEGMARRLALKTGWSIFLSSDIPANSPTLENFAEKRVLQELNALGYIKAKPPSEQLSL